MPNKIIELEKEVNLKDVVSHLSCATFWGRVTVDRLWSGIRARNIKD